MNFKHISIRQITILVTTLVTLVSILAAAIILHFFGWIWLAALVPAVLLLNFFIVRYFLEEFVFRKIKIIFKLIFESKKDKKIPDLSGVSLEDVNSKVVEWAEDTRKEIATLKSLEEYRKSFVGNISHELKTPIFSIQAYLHTLLEGGLKDDTINMEYLQRAANNTLRLQNIVEDLDVISRLESGKAELEMRRFDIRELVTEIMEDLRPMARAKKIKLQIKESASQAFIVIADREAIRQVINNLLVNSIKYGKDGGNTRVSFYDMDSNVLTEVSDNGIGIDEKHIKHVFDRFYRVDSSRSRKMGGSGLGLSIVKHIIEAHDQTINVRSTPDLGSTFGFTLKKAPK